MSVLKSELDNSTPSNSEWAYWSQNLITVLPPTVNERIEVRTIDNNTLSRGILNINKIILKMLYKLTLFYFLFLNYRRKLKQNFNSPLKF